MTIQEKTCANSITFYWSDLLSSIPHGMFTRLGGSSQDDFQGLNLGFYSKDDPEYIKSNIEDVKSELEIDEVIYAKQVHGKKVHIIDDKKSLQSEVECDAIITNQKNVGLLIQQADCQAILLYDPVLKVIGNIHSGWRGSIQNIISETVNTMTLRFNSKAENIIAIISPSLGPCCAEFVNYKKEFPVEYHNYQVKENHFDFWKISKDQLIETGIQEKNIDCANICTECDTRFFSYRRSRKEDGNDAVTGRNASIIAIKQEKPKKKSLG